MTEEKVGNRNDITLLSLTKQGVIIRDLSEGKGKFPKDFETYLVVRPNNLVFCLFDIDETPRTVGLVRNYGMLTGAYSNFEVNEDMVLPEYAYYYYLQIDDVKGLRPYYTGLRKVVKINTFLQLRMPVPPLSEQRSIVSFLDAKCGKIDEWVTKKQKEVEHLQELKQRVIADAVTRGLNPHVKMKTTNIPWLKEIPEHWERTTLRKFLRLFSEKNHGDKQLLSVTREQGVIVRDIESKEGNHNFIPDDLSGYKYVQIGDFVINKMKSWQGSYGVSNYEGIVSPAYYTCKLEGIDRTFFNLAIRSKIYVSFFGRYSKGIRVDQWDLSPFALTSIPFAVPPLSEQKQIVSYLDAKCSKIDKLIDNVTKEIECIKEYKQRLISDVVTGQIKVC